MSTYSRDDLPVAFEEERGEMRAADAGKMRVTFERWDAGDYADMFADQPDGRCQAEHWGYVLKGSMTITTKDGKEDLKAGQAYYIEPGHIPSSDEGVELVEFTPVD